MNLPKILSLLPKHPRKAYLDAIVRKPWEYGMYVACDIFDGNEKTYRLIFLDNIEQLIDFIPSLLLSNLSVLDIGINNNSIDYTEIYNLYNKFRKIQKLTLGLIAELENDWGFINVLNAGFISTFFNISLEIADYMKNNPKIVDYDEFEKTTGLNMSDYYILSGFIKMFDAMPSKLPTEFLEYLASLNAQ
jgi:hypothetical protein